MISDQLSVKYQTPCRQCPLAGLSDFRALSEDEQTFMSAFKTGELNVDAHTILVEEGTHSAHLFTILSGWAFRFKTLEDGRRQILNYVLPGDLIGLQSALMREMQHSVETLTPATFCVFQRDRLHELYAEHPSLAFDVTWLAAREEMLLDEHLLSIGRRTALERTAYLLAYLGSRAISVGLAVADDVTLPLTQQHIADTLGLSLVHTNKTLRKLANRGLVRWHDRVCHVCDVDELAQIAGWDVSLYTSRPFI